MVQSVFWHGQMVLAGVALLVDLASNCAWVKKIDMGETQLPGLKYMFFSENWRGWPV